MTRPLPPLIGRSLLAPLLRFWRDEGGVTAIEFAILAPPFFAMIAMIMEASLLFLSAQILDGAVHEATRLIRTGQVQEAKLTLSKFEDMICGRLFGMFGDCHALQIRVTPIDSFKSIDMGAPLDLNCKVTCPWTMDEAFDTGKGSSIMLVRVYYKWPVILRYPSILPNLLDDGTVLMGSVDVFRNEPFGGV